MTLKQMQQRRDTAARWTSVNPVLRDGEFGFEKDTGRFKVGDGATLWTGLGYFTGLTVDGVELTEDNAAQFTIAGVPVGDPVALPSAAWESVIGRPDLNALGVTSELLQDFTAAADGTPTTADTGQAWTRTYINATNTPVLAGGRFVSNGVNAGTGAAYLTALLDADVTYLEADFAFDDSGSTATQVAAIIAWHTNLPSGAIGAVPDSPCHLIFGDTSYSFQVFSGGTNIPVATVTYGSARGTALQHVEVAIDAANSAVYVRGPDGVVTKFTHALVGSVSARYACCEVFYVAANTDNRIAFSRFGASSAPLEGLSRGQVVKQDYEMLSGGAIYPTIGFMRDVNGNVILNLLATASAVNYLNLHNNVATGRPGLVADGTDTNVGIQLAPKGTGDVAIYQQAGAATLNVLGGDTNVDLNINTKGTGTLNVGGVINAPKVNYLKDTGGNPILNLLAVASSTNYLGLANSNGGYPAFQADGASTDVGISLNMKGAGFVQIYQPTGGAKINATGADTDVDLNLATKGAGVVKANSNPVGVKVGVPSTATSTGVVGQWAADASFHYTCTATNTWRRVAHSSW